MGEATILLPELLTAKNAKRPRRAAKKTGVERANASGRLCYPAIDALGLTILVEGRVLGSHLVSGEILLDVLPHGMRTHVELPHALGHIPYRTASVSRNAVAHDFRNRTAGKRKNWRAAGHGFDHY